MGNLSPELDCPEFAVSSGQLVARLGDFPRLSSWLRSYGFDVLRSFRFLRRRITAWERAERSPQTCHPITRARSCQHYHRPVDCGHGVTLGMALRMPGQAQSIGAT
ncbi:MULTISPECIES: hypothetical protein [Kribbella]|uniref:hypothetical protein n=1 Tax=Kribbella TaxID=182639 RepID=UPI001048846C|nr:MULTISPECIES: hypothetical protein [Kribbella]